MHKKFKFHIYTTLGAIAVFFLFVFIFSYRMDPFFIYSSVKPYDWKNLLSEIPARQFLSHYSYVTKSKQIIDLKPSRIILGSSVADHAFRIPGSVALTYAPYKVIYEKFENYSPNNDVYNAAIRGCALEVAWDYLRHAYANNPHLKEVILSIDLSTLTALYSPQDLDPDVLSILGKTHTPFNFYCKYTLSMSAFQKSFFILLTKYYPGITEKDLEIVFMPTKAIATLLSTQLLKISKNSSLQHNNAPRSANKLLSFLPKAPPPPHLYSIDDNLAFMKLFSSIEALKVLYNKKKNIITCEQEIAGLEALQKIVNFCTEKKIKLKVYVSPIPQFSWAVANHLGLQKDFYRLMRKIANITPFYNFSLPIEFSENVNLFFSADWIHYNENAGIIIYETLLQEKLGPQTQIINAQNITQFIKWHKKILKKWLLSHSSWKQAIETLLPTKEAISPISISFNDLSHIETYEPSYRGYKIYSIGELYLAVPLSLQPPFDVLKLISLNYPGTLKEYSLQDIINAINRKNKSKA